MIVYILLIIMNIGDGTSSQQIEFKTLDSCQKAIPTVKKITFYSNAVCIEVIK